MILHYALYIIDSTFSQQKNVIKLKRINISRYTDREVQFNSSRSSTYKSTGEPFKAGYLYGRNYRGEKQQ